MHGLSAGSLSVFVPSVFLWIASHSLFSVQQYSSTNMSWLPHIVRAPHLSTGALCFFWWIASDSLFSVQQHSSTNVPGP